MNFYQYRHVDGLTLDSKVRGMMTLLFAYVPISK